MSMQEKPVVSVLPDGGKYWTHDFEDFSAMVYVPAGDPSAEVINYGFRAPYLLVFGEPDRSIGDAVDFAERRGLADIARSCSSSVVFVVPRCEGGWQAAPDDLFQAVAAESKIGQYYEDGYIINYKFRTKDFIGTAIRGSLFRTVLYGFGASADYIARCSAPGYSRRFRREQRRGQRSPARVLRLADDPRQSGLPGRLCGFLGPDEALVRCSFPGGGSSRPGDDGRDLYY